MRPGKGIPGRSGGQRPIALHPGMGIPGRSQEGVINLWLETYQWTRDFQPRGIVEVILNDS